MADLRLAVGVMTTIGEYIDRHICPVCGTKMEKAARKKITALEVAWFLFVTALVLDAVFNAVQHNYGRATYLLVSAMFIRQSQT